MTDSITPQTTRQFSSEMSLNSVEQQEFWRQVTQARLTVSPTVELAYAMIKHPDNARAIVVSSGRIESYIKYQELIFDIYQQGYSVYALDHRGQGLSSRLTANPHQGHVDKFDDYISDFNAFIEVVVKPEQHKKLFLVGHSMGGAIGTLYMAQQPDTFESAVFSAPMFGIKLPMNKPFIRWLAEKLDNGNKGMAPNYILGGQDYKPTEFKNNNLTHSKLRYEHYRGLYQAQPQLQLGSPTNRWLVESIDAADKCVSIASNIATPILILQASEDTIVDNQSQNHAVANQCALIKIEKARHEIFMERDKTRNKALTQLFKFFEQ